MGSLSAMKTWWKRYFKVKPKNLFQKELKEEFHTKEN